MPLVNGKVMSPDDAMAAGRCPECGVDLRESNPIAHRRSHWKRQPPWGVDGDEARRRMVMFDKFIADNKVRTSNMQAPKTAGVNDPPVGA
jgi:hypothetical protein